MARKRYFSIRQFERKTFTVDADLHLLVSRFAEDADITIAEAIYLLTAPGLAAARGLDYSKPIGLIKEQMATKL